MKDVAKEPLKNPVKYPRHQLGKQAEQSAEEWFLKKSKNTRLLGKNYRKKCGEIDLIFEEFLETTRQWELVFVEVRSRSDARGSGALLSVGYRKCQKLERVMNVFLSQYNGPAKSVRFDVLFWNGKTWEYAPSLRFD